MHFFDKKMRLFGHENIMTSSPLLKDLDKQDLNCIESASLQVLLEHDIKGRSVIFYRPRWEGDPKCLVSNKLLSGLEVVDTFC